MVTRSFETSAQLQTGASERPRARSRRLGITVIASAIGIVLAAFAGAGAAARDNAGSRSAATGTLNIGVLYLPFTLNPALNGYNVFNAYTLPSYGAMIYATPTGQFVPGFASSFGYVGTGNKVFQMTLRHDVKFNDGTLMTAKDVVASIKYFKGANGPEASTLSGLTSVQATGKWTVKLTLSAPNPLLPLLFSQEYTSGEIIEGKAIAKPSLMSNASFGAGPYMLDSSNTVLNDHYTFVPNPNFYDKSQQHYGKIVIKSIANATSRLQALQSGQVDVAYGDPSTADAAANSGFGVYYRAIATQALFLFDRAGKMAAPLGDVRVRQALNYAIDRPSITKALFGKYALVTQEMALQGSDIYDPKVKNAYAYNPAKAKQLLAAAGYGSGFTLTVLSSPGLNDLFCQALAGQFQAIGVKLDIVSEQPAQMSGDEFAGKFPAACSAYGDYVGWFSSQLLLQPAGVLNPLHSSDATLNGLLAKLAAVQYGTPGAIAIGHQIADRVSTLAWFAPVFNQSEIWYANKKTAGVPLDFLGTSNILAYRPAK